MENEVRSGLLLVRTGAGLVKKFQKRWGALYKRSSHGVSRLEIFDSKENFEKRAKGGKKHLISLEQCATISRNIVHEGKKTEYVITLTFNDSKENILHADSGEEMELWYSALSSVIFGGGDLMDNVIYHQYGDEGYDVVIKENDVVRKLNLKGSYVLRVSKEDIELVEKSTQHIVAKWPLQLLRKYGRDKQEFSLEAGRRCPTGAGMFYFITDHYNAIFQDVDNKVRNLAERTRAHSTSSTRGGVSPTVTTMPGMPPDSPLPSSPIAPSAPSFQSVYDDPIDMRKGMPQIEESIYNEPVNSKPKKPSKSVSPNHSKADKSKANMKSRGPAGPAKPERAQPKKWLGGGKKDQKKAKNTKLPPTPAAPDEVEEATYASANNIEDPNAYGHLNFEGADTKSNGSVDNQYDSLNVEYPGGKPPVAEDSEYATAGDLQRFKGLSTNDSDGLYDKVKR